MSGFTVTGTGSYRQTRSRGSALARPTAALGRWLLILLLAQAPLLLAGCGYLAAGAAGGVIGHEIAKECLASV